MGQNFDDHVTFWFNEERVKIDFITSLYDGIEGSVENAKMLASGYENITEQRVQGKETASDGIVKVKDYLENVELVLRNETDFERQLHVPAKCAAQFRAHVSNLDTRHVTELDGWVFAISDPFNDGFGNRRRTLSVIFPEICAAVSIRMKEESIRHVEREMHKFSRILPIPFVNRATHKDTPIERIGGVPEPEKLRFLMTSMADAESLRTTICFENYCDIPTPFQSKRRGYLGAPVILAGKIIAAGGSFVTIQSQDGTQIKFQLAYSIACQQGQHVAVLASIFYGQSHPNSPPPEYPEIFHLWKITEEQTKEFDEFGHKRLRGDASAYDTVSLSDPIQKMFVDSNKKIRQMREDYVESETLIIDFGNMLSAQAVSEERFAGYLKKEKGMIHRTILVECAELLDSCGQVEKRNLVEYICKFHTDLESGMVVKKFNFMFYCGILEQSDGEIIRPTRKGYNVLSRIKDDEIASSLKPNQHGIIDLTDKLPCRIPSLLLQKIKDSGKYEKVAEYETFWIEKGKSTPSTEKEAGRMASPIENMVIAKLEKITSHSKLLEFFPTKQGHSYFSVKWIMEHLAADGRISVDKKGLYFINDRDKILDFLTEHIGGFYSVEKIWKETSIRHADKLPADEKLLIQKLADELVDEGLVEKMEFPSGTARYAVCTAGCEEEKINYLGQYFRSQMFTGKKKTVWDTSQAISVIRRKLEGVIKDTNAMAKKIIQKNIDDGWWEIVEDGVVLRQKKN